MKRNTSGAASRGEARRQDVHGSRRARTTAAARDTSRARRFARRAARRLAALVALLILFYATSLHGIGLRTLVLTVILLGCMYWLFRDVL